LACDFSRIPANGPAYPVWIYRPHLQTSAKIMDSRCDCPDVLSTVLVGLLKMRPFSKNRRGSVASPHFDCNSSQNSSHTFPLTLQEFGPRAADRLMPGFNYYPPPVYKGPFRYDFFGVPENSE
jgi:hypothetical protein